MPYQTRIPEALARFGVPVEIVPGWQGRGNPAFNPKGAVGHHTAGPAGGDRPSLTVVTQGRPDLPGPLCNVFLARNGHGVVVAAGRANHAGAGGFRGLAGNSAVYGTEAESTGLKHPDGTFDWTAAQRDMFPRVQAALLWLAGRDASWYCAHRTWAPTRKIDPTGMDDAAMRAAISRILADPATPALTRRPRPEEPDMIVYAPTGGGIHLLANGKLVQFHATGPVNELQSNGALVIHPDQDTWNGMVKAYGQPILA